MYYNKSFKQLHLQCSQVNSQFLSHRNMWKSSCGCYWTSYIPGFL